MELIYFDNAATSFPKPEPVLVAHTAALRNLGSAGRGGHRLALDAARVVFDTRTRLADFLGVRNSERLVFTPGCTYSINIALKGFLQPGDTVLVSALEHNAVMRPLRQLEIERAIRIVKLPYCSRVIVSTDDLGRAIEQFNPKLCAFLEGSNVTGELLDVSRIAAVCKSHATALLIDAAQTAGRREGVLQQDGITFWCASGHKGLLGAPGVGILYVGFGVQLHPLVAGGTGSASESVEMPLAYPDHLEPGTAPIPAIAALGAGLEYIKSIGTQSIVEHEDRLKRQFLRWSREQQFTEEYPRREEANSDATLPIVSFKIKGLSPDRVADSLDRDYQIAVRAGHHCSANAHAVLGTMESGLVRASFGFFNTADQVDRFCAALEALANAACVRPCP